ncbi:hypothetical protein [Dactylosporangium sp. NPDC005555]|uniref:hypothetical protein n=1 Tax=Dactylosporangium sp. NPDC005555 TaxID=3154889 RepID=UPI0033B1848C
MQCSIGEIADEPARDNRVVCRTRRIEEAFGHLVGVGVPARSECGEDPTELREGDGDVCPGRHRDTFGPDRGALSRVRIASDPGDDRIDGVGCCDRHRAVAAK